MGQSAFYADKQDNAQKNPQGHAEREALLRQRINDGLEYYAHHSRHADAGACFTHEAAELSFLGLTSANETALYRAPQMLAGGDAAAQMKELRRATGTLLEGRAVSKTSLHEGMVLGLGPADRNGATVDDVQRSGVIFRDRLSGKLMVAQGAQHGHKPQIATLDNLLEAAEQKHEKLFAADLVAVVEKYGAHPKAKFSYNRVTTDPGGFTGTGITETPADTEATAAVRRQISAGIEHYTKDAAARGVKYKFGNKEGKTAIDCSGFVRKAADSGFMHLSGKRGYSKTATHALDDCSDTQIDTVFRKTGFMLDGGNVNLKNLREGMAIGIDSGDHGWDRGRARGIDHIGTVYKDSKTGRLMFAESSGCHGVHATDLGDWLKHAHRRRLKLYAVDLALMADKMGYTAPHTPAHTPKTPSVQAVS